MVTITDTPINTIDSRSPTNENISPLGPKSTNPKICIFVITCIYSIKTPETFDKINI